MLTTTSAPVRRSPAGRPARPSLAFGPALDRTGRGLLRRLLGQATPGVRVAVNAGWSLPWEQAQWHQASSGHQALLSIRVYAGEVQAGPLWRPGFGCATCAEWRARLVGGHPLTDALAEPAAAPQAGPAQPEWLRIAIDVLTANPLEPGELVTIGGQGSGRHRIARAPHCPVCGSAPPDPRFPPPPARFVSAGTRGDDPLRAAVAPLPLDRTTMRGRLVDPRFGPVIQVMRDTKAPFAMSNAILPGAPSLGYGRARTFGAAEPVAILEAYERLGGNPGPGLILREVPYRDIAGHAVNPASLGGYTAEQYDHPASRVTRYDQDTPMDWAWGHLLGSGQRLLVPAEVAFFRYHHGAQPAMPRKRYFEDCSSGCALGGGLAEATLHALLELHERDAFLLAWHRAEALPAIDAGSIADPLSRHLLDIIVSRGYQPHLLVATADIDLPAIWALAIRSDAGYPASYSAAAAGVDPGKAVRGALWELAQLVSAQPWWKRADAERMLADPWLVSTMDDHVARYSLPETLPRLSVVLGGPVSALGQAFPGWPRLFAEAARGDIRRALDVVADRFRAAGLDRIIVVDQSTREHRDLGLRVVKAVVPGIVPMCFGHPQQRLLGLDRLARMAPPGQAIPYDPHPFP